MTRSRTLVAGLVVAVAASACQTSADERDAAPQEAVPRLAVADGAGVRIRDSTGTFTTVAPVPSGWRVESLIWSGDGERLAWLAVQTTTGTTRVGEAPVTGGAVRQWTCDPRCGAVAWHGDELISDAAEPVDTVNRYPDSGSPQPLQLSGLSVDLGGDRPVLSLLVGSADGVFVATAAAPGGSSAIHRVNADGTAAGVHDTGAEATPRHGTLSADGSQLAYAVDRTVTGCPATETVVLVDLASGQGSPIAPPLSAVPQFVSDLWFDEAGTVYASLLEGPGPCAATPASRPTASATAQVHRRDGTVWRSTGARARQGADLGDGRTALLTGPSTVAPDGVHGSPPGALTLSDSAGSDQVLAKAVTAFAVAPS
ncbi:hypothetical protein [Cryptosporangium aurantiacum]|uniref:WD40-like Beta Propeller Repeat n=1 Tax=Cryptosporangium aurantiacum TaxID=134849 RepID=A0A1M7R9N8_9ACTN|nr:hypothetical protein [Cryptosporangium aurantiacum]SHN42748.1 hypothetical protein SAMN05443668_108355 [Cryptosporangium aurantiacum]